MKKVSVIVACYNCENYIDDCMNSLISQTIGFENIEVILVNDASLDRTIIKLAEYEHRYPENIILIPLTENMRQGGARNIALPYASGEYVLFLDSDDWLVDVALEHLYHAAKEAQAEIVQCRGNHTSDRKLREWGYETKQQNELVELNSLEARKAFLTGEKPIMGCCFKLYRNDFLKKYQFCFAERIAFEEPPFVYPMWFFANRVYFLNEQLYVIYLNPQGTMRAMCTAEERKRDHLISSLQVLEDVKSRGLLGEYFEEIEFYFVHAYFAESLLILKGRGFFIDVELFHEMQQTVKKYFPDYAKNKYLQDPGWVVTKNLLECVEMEIDENVIDQLNDQILKVLKTMMDNGLL